MAFDVEVVGESFYDDNLHKLHGAATDDASGSDWTAVLALDDANPYDPGNAVRVEIHGLQVGHLSREDARRFRVTRPGVQRLECPAMIIAKRGNRAGNYGVRLDLPVNVTPLQTGPPAAHHRAEFSATRTPPPRPRTSRGVWVLLAIAALVAMVWPRGEPATKDAARRSTPAVHATPTTAHTATISEFEAATERARAGRDRALSVLGPQGRKLCAKYSSWTPGQCDTVAHGKVGIGMSPEMVREAWGRPKRINSTSTADGRREQWVYGTGSYVYIRGHEVTSIQQSE